MKHLPNLLDILRPPTLKDVIENKMLAETKSVMQCDHVIKTHEFQKFMSQANLTALALWNQLELLKDKAHDNQSGG